MSFREGAGLDFHQRQFDKNSCPLTRKTFKSENSLVSIADGFYNTKTQTSSFLERA